MDFLFYRIYYFIKKTPAANEAVFAALVYLSAFVGLNLMTIYILLRKLELIPKIMHSHWYGGGLVVLMLLVNLFNYCNNKKYMNIIHKYKNENQSQIKKGYLILIIYIIVTFGFLVSVALYRLGNS